MFPTMQIIMFHALLVELRQGLCHVVLRHNIEIWPVDEGKVANYRYFVAVPFSRVHGSPRYICIRSEPVLQKKSAASSVGADITGHLPN